MGNTKLVEYGIQTEKSDLRAHVSINARSVYVFPTKNGNDAIKNGKHRKAKATTNGITTAEGYLVPPIYIKDCSRIRIPFDIFLRAEFDEKDNTSQKGNKAVYVVREMLKMKLVPITLEINEVTDEDMQMQGTDILIKAKARIQVKCDWRAGEREFGGTGNLFLQISECNPNGMH